MESKRIQAYSPRNLGSCRGVVLLGNAVLGFDPLRGSSGPQNHQVFAEGGCCLLAAELNFLSNEVAEVSGPGLTCPRYFGKTLWWQHASKALRAPGSIPAEKILRVEPEAVPGCRGSFPCLGQPLAGLMPAPALLPVLTRQPGTAGPGLVPNHTRSCSHRQQERPPRSLPGTRAANAVQSSPRYKNGL